MAETQYDYFIKDALGIKKNEINEIYVQAILSLL